MRTVIRIVYTAALWIFASTAWGYDLVNDVSQEEMRNRFVYLMSQTPKIDSRGEFGWKDPAAATKIKIPHDEYVVKCLDPGFVHRLYSLIKAAEEAGFEVGITTLCRDNYRQSIATGFKAKNSCQTYHGGSCHGGIGRAADLVVRAPTRKEVVDKNSDLYVWIDEHGQKYGLCLPYGTKDAGHTAPCDGKEYANHYKEGRSWTRYAANLEAARAKKLAKLGKKHIKVAKHRHKGSKKHRVAKA